MTKKLVGKVAFVTRGSKHVDATCYRHARKIWPEFPVAIPNQIPWCVFIRSCFP